MTATQVIDRPPTTLTEFWSRHPAVVLELSAAGQSAWNGRILEAHDGQLGLADWNGSLHLDREHILDPLTDLYAHPGTPRTEAVLITYREALSTVLHEQAHLLGPTSSSQRKARRAFTKPGSRELEEGVTEAWAVANLDQYLQRLGVNNVAPGIDSVGTYEHYPAFVPATRLLTTDLDRRTGQPPGSTLNALVRETAEGQWPLITDLLYNSSPLPEVVPSRQTPAVRHHFESLLRDSFSRLAVLEFHPPGYAATRSHAYTAMLIDYLDTELTAIHSHFAPSDRHSRQSPTPTHTAFTGLAPAGSPPRRPGSTNRPHAPTRHSHELHPANTLTR